MTTEKTQKRSGPKSGTILALVLIAVIAGLLTAAQLRLKAHQKPVRSIAVLPFLSGTNSLAIDDLCEKLTREIIRNLGEARIVSITPAESVMRYKGNVLSLQRAGIELNVDVVVVGRVQQTHDQLIIQTDLVNVTDESQMWGHEYELNSDSNTIVPEIGKDISNRVIAAISR